MWNKITAFIILLTAASLLIVPFEAEARRGGGGGGGGGARGGAYRGGNVMNRTPTMSRSTNRSGNFQTRQPLQNRPQPAQRQAQQARRSVQQRPSAANRAELRDQVNRYAQNRPVQNIDRQALARKAQNFSNNRSSQIAQNRELSNRVSQNLHQLRPNSNQWFDRNFFDRHNINLGYVGTGANWWRPAAWATLATWGAWNWAAPYYYDENAGYSYPVSVDTSTYASDSSYSTPTTPLPPVQSPQTAETTNGDWLPLGVFAVARDAQAANQTNRFIQLALNRSGELAGVLYNSANDHAQDLTGTVNTNTQMAYWSMADQPGAPVASTSIYNLTQDQTPVNVHFNDGSDQTWTLVRLQQEQ